MMNTDIRNQVDDKFKEKKEFVVFNERTGYEYMRTRCETVARGCYSRMKLKHGEFVKYKVESK